MAEAVGALRVEVSANAAQFEQDMGRVRRSVANGTARMKRDMMGFRGSVAGVAKSMLSLRNVAAGAAAVTALGVAFVAAARKAADHADQIAKTADAVGLTTGEYQELRFAADLAGVSQDAFGSALLGFSKRVGEARNETGTLVTLLKKLDPQLLANVQAAESTGQAFDLVIRKAAEMGNELDRNALLAAAFGRTAGVQMANLVKDGVASIEEARAEARRLGIVIEDDLIRNGVVLKDALTKLSYVFTANLSRALLANADDMARWSEQIATSIPRIIEMTVRLGEMVGLLDRAPIDVAATKLGNLQERLIALDTAIAAQQSGRGGVAQGTMNLLEKFFVGKDFYNIEDMKQSRAEIVAEMQTLTQEIIDIRRRQADAMNISLGGGSGAPGGDAPTGSASGADKPIEDKVAAMIAGLERQLVLVGMTKEQEALHLALLDAQAAAIERKRPLTQREWEDVKALVIARQELTAEIEKQAAAERQAAEDGQEMARIITDGLRAMTQEGANFGDILVDLARKMADLLLEMLIFRQIEESLGKALGGGGGGGGGIMSIFSAVGSLFAKGGPGIYDSSGILSFAEGGSGMVRGQPGRDRNLFVARVSDREQFAFAPAGMPMGEGARDGSGFTFHQHNHFAAGIQRAEFQEQLRESERRTIAAVADVSKRSRSYAKQLRK